MELALLKESSLKWNEEEFPGGPGVRILCFHCRRQGSTPVQGTNTVLHDAAKNKSELK